MSTSPTANITSVLKETRTFAPSPEFAAAAHIKSVADYERLWQRGKDDPQEFWAEQAESLHWTGETGTFKVFAGIMDITDCFCD